MKGLARAPEISQDDMQTMFATNVAGLINMTQAILPVFQARPDGGRGDIINVGSIAGREAYPGGSIYCASKAAVRSFTESLRKELIATRIRVIEVDPGQVETVSLLISNECFLFSTDRVSLTFPRNFHLSGSMGIKLKPMQSMREPNEFVF